MDETAVNQNMENTLDRESEFFWYYNNGITIICDEAERLSRGGRDILRVKNPQVINGQQTTRTIHKKAGSQNKASVLVRVISVPRETEQDTLRFENLVTQIVAATNWQNAINASDLMANDRRQIEIERNFRKLDYQYVRKRQSRGEARRNAGIRHRFMIKRDELAQASAACNLDPSIVRTGKEGLFEERYYSQVFPNSDPNYYLPRYWLVRHVSSMARGYPERAYAKWLVANFVWQQLAPLLRTRTLRELFRRESEKLLFASLCRASTLAFKGAGSFFRANRGSGETATDVSSFFKRRNLDKEFDRFWASGSDKNRIQFEKALSRFVKELNEAFNTE